MIYSVYLLLQYEEMEHVARLKPASPPWASHFNMHVSHIDILFVCEQFDRVTRVVNAIILVFLFYIILVV